MPLDNTKKVLARKRRHRRVRKKVFGTSECPRLSVFRSNKHIYAQIVDDTTGNTLLSLSSLENKTQWKKGRGSDRETAGIVGGMLGKKAIAKSIKKVVFDRNGYLFHGRVKALADGVRQSGVKF